MGAAAAWATLACVLLSCAVFLRRGWEATQATAVSPGVAVTSGFEEESFFALWRAVHGEAVYADPARLPYASGYFNWLFYGSYAGPVGAAAGQWGDSMIPLAGRLVTAGAALIGAAGLAGLLWRVLAGKKLVAAGLAGFVFFGPLVGWWAHTLRPDVGALALETAALAVLLLNCRTRPLAAAAGSGLLFYCAWSFKQTYVLGLGAALLFLVLRRQWGPAALLALGSLVLWVATFLALGPAYRAMIQATAVSSKFYPALGLSNVLDMLAKTAPLCLLAVAGLPGGQGSEGAPGGHPLADDARLVGSLGLVVGTPLAFLASCKLGAASYYFFSLPVMLALVVAGGLARRAQPRLVLGGFGLAAGLQVAVFLGHAGRVTLADQTSSLATTWSVWRQEPEPRFSHLTSLNLPWLSPHSPPLVTAFNYTADRRAGRKFEHDGIGGLITAGYFRTLLLPSDTRDTYDGGFLVHYTRGETSDGLTIFRRRETLTK